MTHTHHRLTRQGFEQLREQVATAASRCADDQLLELADGIHDTLRRRRDERHGDLADHGLPSLPK
jgi:hypothetical protein